MARCHMGFAALWPAPGSEDTELGVLMEPGAGHFLYFSFDYFSGKYKCAPLTQLIH